MPDIVDCDEDQLSHHQCEAMMVLLEPDSVVNLELDIEVAVGGGRNSSELLKTSHSPASEHDPVKACFELH